MKRANEAGRGKGKMMHKRVVFWAVLALLAPVTASFIALPAFAGELTVVREELESAWQARIRSLLAMGTLPLIDLETSLQQEQAEQYIPAVFETFDTLGIVMMSADGYQREQDGSSGYRWSTYILDLVNRYPAYFIPTANGGTNPNWLSEKGGKPEHFIDQMETAIRSGAYYSMGEFDFLHYMSSSQCQSGRTDRDSDIALNGANGHRVFALSAETGVPFVIHLEAEDRALDALDEMLAAYPGAKVIVAHFGQIRHPEVQGRFTPQLVRSLLTRHANLFYDLSTGNPNRKYKCSGPGNNAVLVGDTVLWQGAEGKQSDVLKPEYASILADFSDRFVFATDYGGGRPPLPEFLRERHENFMRIIRDLPEEAKHNIAYRNAWHLLTGRAWQD